MQRQVEAFLEYKERFPKIISGEEKTKEQIERDRREFMVNLEKTKAEIHAKVKSKAGSFLEALKFINDKYGKNYKVEIYPRWNPIDGGCVKCLFTEADREDIKQYEKELNEKYLEIYKNKTLNNETTP